MNKFNLLPICFILLINFGCKDDEEDDFSNENIVETYDIVSFKANKAVDLNNDKKLSTNLINEIFILGNENRYLEIRPAKNLIYFNLPLTLINYDYPSAPDGYVEFVKYGFGTSTTLSDNTIKIKDNSYKENNYTGNEINIKNVSIENLKIIDNNRLSTIVTKSYYDFNTKQWVELKIEVIFQKN
jgi:hypothetical protein